MTRKALKWALPDIVHPVGSICFQVNVPNNIYYLGAFYGAMFLLTKPYAWEDDPAHTALEVAKVWRAIFEKLRPGGCNPPPPPFGHGIEQDDFMPLRVDCDCNVFITCCDGTEKQILTADQVTRLLSNGGAGTPQPQPGGGCQTYHMTIPAGSVGQLIPTIVNSGDTIEVSNLGGAWYGGSITWYCPDGFVFFVDCTGAQNFSGSSQIPLSPIGRVIALIDGTYYDIIGSTFTVPGGIVNQQVTLLMNTDTPSTASGSVTADVKVCNNQIGDWTHVLDFTLNSYSDLITISNAGSPSVPFGQWVPGVGYKDTMFSGPAVGATRRGIGITLNAAYHQTNIRADFALTVGTYDGDTVDSTFCYYYTPGGFTNNIVAPSVPTSPQLDGGARDLTANYIQLLCGSQSDGSDPGGSVALTRLTISGSGPDPFV